jgi:hypothetical protein
MYLAGNRCPVKYVLATNVNGSFVRILLLPAEERNVHIARDGRHWLAFVEENEKDLFH